MDIPVNAETYGIIHSDFHTSNFMLDHLDDGSWDMVAIDFDNSQRSWYIIDLGTVCFGASRQLDTAYRAGEMSQEYATMLLEQFIDWMIIGYALPVVRTELTEACQWRKDFEYWLRIADLSTLDPSDPQYIYSQEYVDLYLSGEMPTC